MICEFNVRSTVDPSIDRLHESELKIFNVVEGIESFCDAVQ